MRVTVFLLLFFLTASASMAIDVQLTIEDRVVRTIDTSQFLSFTFDTSFIRGKFCGINWNKAILLARSLTPCYVRLGGDDSDFLIFKRSSTSNLRDITTTTPGIDANGCSMFDSDNFFMTPDQFDRFNWFVQSSGLKLLLDLNGVYNRQNGTWNPSNQVDLLDYARQMNYAMDFELGNEPDLYPRWYTFTISGKELVSNYRLMRSILNSYPKYNGSRLVGPSVASLKGPQYKEFLDEGGLDYVDAVTFHHYYGSGAGQHVDFFINPDVLDKLTPLLEEAVSLVKRHNNSSLKEVWLGETSSAYHGGAPGISNSYAAGFMWMDKLALCALHGIDAVFRQTFYMGNYAMTNDDTSPRPDYWLSLLYRTLIGNQVLAVKSNVTGRTAKHLRFYAHKNETHMILFGMNLLVNETAEVRLGAYTGSVMQYLLEPKDGVLTSKEVLLNGRELIFDGQNSPTLLNMGVLVAQPIRVPSLRFGMWVWRYAEDITSSSSTSSPSSTSSSSQTSLPSSSSILSTTLTSLPTSSSSTSSSLSSSTSSTPLTSLTSTSSISSATLTSSSTSSTSSTSVTSTSSALLISSLLLSSSVILIMFALFVIPLS